MDIIVSILIYCIISMLDQLNLIMQPLIKVFLSGNIISLSRRFLSPRMHYSNKFGLRYETFSDSK